MLGLLKGGLDFRLQVGRVLAVVAVLIGADLGGDGEADRHRQAEVGHLAQRSNHPSA
jgi:hypothetical protein